MSWDHELPDHDDPDQELPDHDDPDQELPDQELPVQVALAQCSDDQELPDHDDPDHDEPDHEDPDQDEPDHELPFQVPPDHELPAASAAARAAVSTGRPNMSTSPVNATPCRTNWLVPRAPSRVPVPTERGKVCGTAAFICPLCSPIKPAPWARTPKPGNKAVWLTSKVLTWSGVKLGRPCMSSAAAPEIAAAACDVPLPRKKRALMVPVEPYVWSMYDPGTRKLWMWAPGATRSGLRVPSPQLENEEIVSSAGDTVP
jgi:hypothetical protein